MRIIIGWRLRWLSLAGSIGLGLALVAAALLGLPAARALAAPAGTTYTYPGSGSCSTTLQACINAAAAGDTINILAGTYIESFTLNRAVSLIGAGAYSTKFVAQASQRVLTVSGSLTTSTVISGLMFTGGQAADYGGGIFIVTPAQPLLVSLVISNNHAVSGGGIAMDPNNGTPLPLQLKNSLVYSNVASAGGGGLRGPANLVDDQFISNTGSGGGVWTFQPLTITRGSFERNHGGVQGGAVQTFSSLVMTGTAVVSNTSTGAAGGVQVAGLGAPLFAGGYFSGNQGLNGGGLAGYAVTFSGTVFANNTSMGPGGAINVSGPLNGTNGRFEANHALGATTGQGGAIYAGGAMTLTGMTLLSNTAEAEGGAVFSLSGGRLTGGHLENNASAGGYGGGMSMNSSPSYPTGFLDLSGTNFISNSAYDGGGLYVYQPAVITGGTFTRNQAAYGGGIEIDDPLSLNGANFINNHASSDGGGVYVYQGAASITGGVFISNSAVGDGGGLDINDFGLIASGTVFSGNSAATGDGGGAQVEGAVTITAGLFQANHSGGYGGGLYINGGDDSRLSQTDFISNSAVNDGGGLNDYHGQVFISGGRFERNTALSHGGGWYANYGATLTNTVIVSNTAAWGGGGAADEGLALTGVQLAGNQATSGGGGLYILSGLYMDTSRLAGNSAPQGGGIYMYGSATIVNSLLADNQASVVGASLYFTYFGNTTVIHSTIAAASLSPRQAIVLNSGSLHVTDTILSNYAVGISLTSGSATQNFNLFYGNSANTAGSVTGGANSLTGQNPLFANPAGGDYHLTGASPAIDHGTNAGINVDYDGDPRPEGAGFDIGFDEHTALLLNHRLFLPLALR